MQYCLPALDENTLHGKCVAKNAQNGGSYREALKTGQRLANNRMKHGALDTQSLFPGRCVLAISGLCLAKRARRPVASPSMIARRRVCQKNNACVVFAVSAATEKTGRLVGQFQWPRARARNRVSIEEALAYRTCVHLWRIHLRKECNNAAVL